MVWIRLGFGEGNGWGVGEWGIEGISSNKRCGCIPDPTRRNFIGRTTLLVWLYLRDIQ